MSSEFCALSICTLEGLAKVHQELKEFIIPVCFTSLTMLLLIKKYGRNFWLCPHCSFKVYNVDVSTTLRSSSKFLLNFVIIAQIIKILYLLHYLMVSVILMNSNIPF